MAEPRRVEVAVVGTGFSGIAAAIYLEQAGISDYCLLEAGERLGGTWRDNTYPGAACDVASHLYSLSIDPNPDWGYRFARQPEIQAYLERVVEKRGLLAKVRFGCRVVLARFEAGRWLLRCANGEALDARFVIFGVGALRDPRWPAIPGLDSFAGPVVHSARWPDALSLAGKRVGVVGTGASAIQLVPAIADQVASLAVFQRTPSWVRPRRDRAIPAWKQRAYRRVPLLAKAERLRLYLAYEVQFPLIFQRWRTLGRVAERFAAREVRAAAGASAVPRYRIGCKRVLLSDSWYPALAKPQVRVITERVARVVPAGVELEGGESVGLDVLVCCTGFTVDQPLGELVVQGVNGQDLGETWGGRPHAYLGVAVPGFPNSYQLLGPNTALGHNSVVIMIEAAMRLVVQAITRARALPEGRWLDVRPEAMQGFLAEMAARHAPLVWASGCDSWYLAGSGENFTIWPGTTLSYLRRTRRMVQQDWVEGGA